MDTNVNYLEKAKADCIRHFGIDVKDAQPLHNGRQNTLVVITDRKGEKICVRYRTAVEFWYEDCIKEPFIESLGIVDMPAVRFVDDTVRPQILISEFVEGELLHTRGVDEETAFKVGKLIAQVHIPSQGASCYMDFLKNKVSADLWADQFLQSLKEEAVLCEYKLGDINALLNRCHAIWSPATQDSLVLVHNDLHFKNMIARPNGSICLIDWDSAVIAPPEKDFVKLLDWSHENTTAIPNIIRSYQNKTGRVLNMDAVAVFRIYACLRQIHYQTASMQKGVDSSVLNQKGFFDDNQKQHQRLCAVLSQLGLSDWHRMDSATCTA